MTEIKKRTLLMSLGAFLIGILVLAAALQYTRPVQAAAPSQEGEPPNNAVCLSCHLTSGQTTTLSSGDQLYISISPAAYGASAHGKENIGCVECHTDVTAFPHPENNMATAREYTAKYQESCRECHEDQYTETADSVHDHAMRAGNPEAPYCTDCHNPHTQPAFHDANGNFTRNAKARVAQVCARCHSEIFSEFGNSVHGEGVLVTNNNDAPTCIDCHGVHQITDPTTAQFRLNSPRLCAECHTDETMMAKYDLSTEVLNTYVADFHGTTVTLFEKTSPDQATNKPVCYDCHGVHNIAAADDPEKGLAVKQNILAACQRCHPGANENFPDTWLSHYIPSRDKYPLVYWVNVFYMFFIPGVLGAMAIFVVSDIGRKISDIPARRKKKPSKPISPPLPPEPPVSPKEEESK